MKNWIKRSMRKRGQTGLVRRYGRIAISLTIDMAPFIAGLKAARMRIDEFARAAVAEAL